MVDWKQSLRNAHGIECVAGWQYGVVHQLALRTEPHYPDVPPPGNGWELNVDRGDAGRSIELPIWSDGAIVQQLTWWRREHGLPWPQGAAHIHVNRRTWWVGSKIPDRMLPVDNVRGDDRDRGKLSVVASRVP